MISRTQVRRITRELKLRNEELIISGQRYHEIFNATSDALVIHEADIGKILDVNRAMLEMYQLNYNDALKANIAQISSNEEPYNQIQGQAHIKDALDTGPRTFE